MIKQVEQRKKKSNTLLTSEFANDVDKLWRRHWAGYISLEYLQNEKKKLRAFWGC